MAKVVILDPGHGGIDPLTKKYVTPGKRSPQWPDGSVFYEGVGNREIVRMVGQVLVKKGVKVLYTVEPENWKDVSLATRCQIANDHYRRNREAIVISVHSNGHDKPEAKGFEVWTSPGQTKSDSIATLWYQEQAKQFPELVGRKDTTDGDVDKEEKFYILVNTAAPAILVETMFHTNPAECKILQSPEGQKKIVQAIVNTLLKA